MINFFLKKKKNFLKSLRSVGAPIRYINLLNSSLISMKIIAKSNRLCFNIGLIFMLSVGSESREWLICETNSSSLEIQVLPKMHLTKLLYWSKDGISKTQWTLSRKRNEGYRITPEKLFFGYELWDINQLQAKVPFLEFWGVRNTDTVTLHTK